MSQGGSLESPPPCPAANVPDGPPPSYDSLFGRLKEARQSSSGNIDFLKNFSDIVFGTLGCTIVLGLLVAIPVSMIAIGTIYLHDCPAEPYIPIYLIVAGVFGVLKQLLEFFTQYRRRSEESVALESAFGSLITCFMLAWAIAGCVWIYTTYEPEYVDLSSARYCNKTLYLFSFWLTNAGFIVVGICIALFCIICIVTIAAVQLD